MAQNQQPIHNIPLNVPKEITTILEEDLCVQNAASERDSLIPVSDYSAPEIVLFCAPPSLVNGFTIPFCIDMVRASLIAATAGLAMSSLSQKQIFALFFSLFSYMLCGFCVILIHKWQLFGYRVVTNHRACLVIPSWRYFCPPGVINTFFKSNLRVIEQRGSFKANRRECWESKKETHIAVLEPRKSDSNAGYATIYGQSYSLDFGLIAELSVLEDVLEGAVLSSMNDIKFRPQYHFQVRSSMVPSYWIYFKNIIIHIFFSLMEISVYFVILLLSSYSFPKAKLNSWTTYLIFVYFIINMRLCLSILISGQANRREKTFVGDFSESAKRSEDGL